MIQIITFFFKMFKLYIVLAYNLEFNWIQTLRFLYQIIHLLQKLKKLDGHLMENYTQTEIQVDLDSLIFILNTSLGTKLKIKWDTWRKIKNPVKI